LQLSKYFDAFLFPLATSADVARRSPAAEGQLVVSDRFGDIIKDRLDLALRMGDHRRGGGGAPELDWRTRRSGRAKLNCAARQTIHACRRRKPPLHRARYTDVWTFVTPEGPQDFRVSGGFLANDSRSRCQRTASAAVAR
jgi:hypothetical protein